MKAVVTQATGYTSLDHFPLVIMSAFETQITNQINDALFYSVSSWDSSLSFKSCSKTGLQTLTQDLKTSLDAVILT